MANHQVASDDSSPDPEVWAVGDARDALQDLNSVRARFGRKLATPWWYKLVSALIIAVLFVGAGMPYESISFGSVSTGASFLVLTLSLGPLLLRDLLKRSTGASFDRYNNGWTLPSLALVSLLVACVSLQKFADVDLAPLVGAAIGFVFTVVYEEWTDRRLARGEFRAASRRGRA